MDEAILHILNVVLAAGRAQVAIRVEVALQVIIHCRGQGVESNVEFAILVEQGSLAVLLDNVGALLAIHDVVAHDLLDLGEVLAHGDAAATVCILARLDNPQVFAHGWELYQVWVLVRLVVTLLEFQEFPIL